MYVDSLYHQNPNYIVYPHDVCRNYIQGRCFRDRCKFRHWSHEEVRAFRESYQPALDSNILDVVARAAPVSLRTALPVPLAEADPTPIRQGAVASDEAPTPGSDSGGEEVSGHDDERSAVSIVASRVRGHSSHDRSSSMARKSRRVRMIHPYRHRRHALTSS